MDDFFVSANKKTTNNGLKCYGRTTLCANVCVLTPARAATTGVYMCACQVSPLWMETNNQILRGGERGRERGHGGEPVLVSAGWWVEILRSFESTFLFFMSALCWGAGIKSFVGRLVCEGLKVCLCVSVCLCG